MCADGPVLQQLSDADLALTLRDKIFQIEAEVLKCEQLDIPVKHTFAPGIYAREITIPKGALVTGKVHRHAHINIVSKGDISVMTESGPMRIRAPFTFVAAPGTKRVGYAHEDTVWTTIHSSNETDLARLEAELIIPADSPEALTQALEKISCLG